MTDTWQPMISVEEWKGAWQLVVRGFHGETVGRLPFIAKEDAEMAEQGFRHAMANAPDGQALKAAKLWFARMASQAEGAHEALAVSEWWKDCRP